MGRVCLLVTIGNVKYDLPVIIDWTPGPLHEAGPGFQSQKRDLKSMTNKDAGGNSNCPHDSEQSGLSDRVTEADADAAARTKVQAGSGNPPESRSVAGLEYSEDSTRATVATWLIENIETAQYYKSRDIASELDLSEQQVGSALGMIADDDLPVSIERWGESKGRVTWYIQPARDDVEAVTDGGQVERPRGVSRKTTDAVVEALTDLDGLTDTKARRLDIDVDVSPRVLGRILGHLAEADDAPVDVEQMTSSRNTATWRIDPPERPVATDGGPYTVPTGPGYCGTFRVHEQVQLSSSDLARLGLDEGDRASAVPSRDGVRVVPGDHDDAIQTEVAKVSGSLVLEFYRPVLDELGVVDGEDVRLYEVDGERALEIVPASDDPKVEGEPMTDGGLDCPQCGHQLDTEDENEALANDPDVEFFCANCGALYEDSVHIEQRRNGIADDQRMADGGIDDAVASERVLDEDSWYVVDKARTAVVGGPYEDEMTATIRARERGANHGVVTGDVLQERERDASTTLIWELGDVDVMTDGGTDDGAIDNGFDDATVSPTTQLQMNLADVGGRTHANLAPGDIAIDLVTRQPLYILNRTAHDLIEYYEREEFDLLSYKQHPFLPVRESDAVYECVFIGNIDDLHTSSKTYDYPAGRLARVPLERDATNGGDD